jgi:hypothetical protein
MDKVDNYHVNLTLLDLVKLTREDIARLNRGEFPPTGDECPLQLWRRSGFIRPLELKPY